MTATPKMPEAIAKTIAERFRATSYYDELVSRIAAALRAERERAVRDCERVALEYPRPVGHLKTDDEYEAARHGSLVADRIRRALASRGGDGAGNG